MLLVADSLFNLLHLEKYWIDKLACQSGTTTKWIDFTVS